MYQRVLRDPGGDEIVRVISDVDIVDGSILLVPADTVAFFVCNGLVSSPYAPGRYEICPGVSPFFVRLRNLMTRGDAGITVQIFYVNTKREFCMRAGTGDIVFNEKRFDISLKAMAAYTIRYVVDEPLKFLQQLVGMHRDEFYVEDILPAVESMLKPYVREEIAKYLSANRVTDFQNELIPIGNNIHRTLCTVFRQYGINLRAVVVTAVNISDSELARLRVLEEKYAGGIVQTDVEVDNVKRVYGNVNNRTIAEAITGSVRGSASHGRRNDGNGCGGNMMDMMVALPMQIALANQVAGAMNGSVTEMMKQSGWTNGTVPDLPIRKKKCKKCTNEIEDKDSFCKFCGERQ